MIFNRKIEILFDKKTLLILDSQSKICNWLYNHLLDMIKKDYDLNNNALNLLHGRNLRNLVPIIKRENLFLYCVHSSPLKNVALRLKLSFEKFFKEGAGYPKFKAWKVKWFSLYYDEPNKGFKLLNDNQIRISLGLDKEHKHLRVFGKLKEQLALKETDNINNFRICKEHGRYYGIFCIDRQNIKQKEIKSFISIDQNHKNFFVGIDHRGESIEFKKITQINYFDKLIDGLKSKRDQCKKYSNRWKRRNNALDNLYHKKREQIKSMCYSIANDLVRNYDCIAIGDYTPSLTTASESNMHRSMLNQSIISKFRHILEWVVYRSGKTIKVVDEHNTTKTCCICGHLEKKEPSIRELICTECHTKLNRDVNSSVNIAKKAKILSGSDYVNWDLSQVTYTTEWDFRYSRIWYSVGYAKQKVA